jgi:hypothetical protein
LVWNGGDYQGVMSSLDWNEFDAEGSAAESVKLKPVTKIGRVVEEMQTSRALAAMLMAATIGWPLVDIWRRYKTGSDVQLVFVLASHHCR